MTLLFNVLVTASPKELAGDVGSLRGMTQNMVAAVGTAVVGALVVDVLSAGVMRHVTNNPLITAEMTAEVNLDSINFLSNDRLKEHFCGHEDGAGAGCRGRPHQHGDASPGPQSARAWLNALGARRMTAVQNCTSACAHARCRSVRRTRRKAA